MYCNDAECLFLRGCSPPLRDCVAREECFLLCCCSPVTLVGTTCRFLLFLLCGGGDFSCCCGRDVESSCVFFFCFVGSASSLGRESLRQSETRSRSSLSFSRRQALMSDRSSVRGAAEGGGGGGSLGRRGGFHSDTVGWVTSVRVPLLHEAEDVLVVEAGRLLSGSSRPSPCSPMILTSMSSSSSSSRRFMVSIMAATERSVSRAKSSVTSVKLWSRLSHSASVRVASLSSVPESVERHDGSRPRRGLPPWRDGDWRGGCGRCWSFGTRPSSWVRAWS
mmetsp:Transcript_27199/g.83501  ORF Transcript_27199/g.83501 Transcript_27199/m.83501 type:complete len:278 (+) Transcript_27199:410-1243(+)